MIPALLSITLSLNYLNKLVEASSKDLTTPSTLFFLTAKLAISPPLGKLKPYVFSLVMSNSWLRQSKTFDKSVSKAPNAFPLWSDFCLFSSIAKRHWCMLNIFRKLYWYFKNRLSKKLGHFCKDTLSNYFW